MIFSEVWDEVVHWVAFLAGWYPGSEGLSVDLSIKLGVEIVIWGQIPSSVLSLLLMHMVERVNDIVVDTEVWNVWWCGISSSWRIWVVPFSVFLFGKAETVMGLSDILILAEVWHKVISLGWWILLILSDRPFVI